MTGRHLLLVGLPGAGKTTVGRLLAEGLAWPFVDADDVIEERARAPVPKIFADQGEAAFRRLERDVVDDLLGRPGPTVIAPGGGWAARAGALEAARPHAVTVYLETDPAVALQRTLADRNHPRPLLEGGEEGPDRRMRRLHADREPYYRVCEVRISTDARRPDEVAAELIELARSHCR